METEMNSRLNKMECFDSLFPDESSEITAIEEDYMKRLKEFCSKIVNEKEKRAAEKEMNKLREEMFNKITAVTDKAMSGFDEIHELRDLYVNWLLDKDIEITPTVANIVNLNIVPLIQRGLIKEEFVEPGDSRENKLYYVNEEAEDSLLFASVVGKSFSFSNKCLVLYRV